MASKKDSEVEKSKDLVQEVNVGELVKVEDPVKGYEDPSLGRVDAGVRHERVPQQLACNSAVSSSR